MAQVRTRVICANARRMLSYDPDTAPKTGYTKRRTHLRHTRPPSNHVRLHHALVAVAVVVLLLVSSGAQANLVEEVPLTHWSYQALERLASADFVDFQARESTSPHALTRFQLASATREALALAATMTTAADVEGVEPRRELAALFTALELKLENAAALERSLSRLTTDADESSRSVRGFAVFDPADGVDGVDGFDGVERVSEEWAEIKAEAERLKDDVRPLLVAAEQSYGHIIAPEAVQSYISRFRTVIERLNGSIDEALTLVARLDEEEASRMRSSPTLLESVAAYMRKFGGDSQVRVNEATPTELVDDLRRLAKEYAADIERLGGLGAQGIHIQDLLDGESERARVDSEERRNVTEDRGVSLDAIIAALEKDHRGSRSQRSVSFPLPTEAGGTETRSGSGSGERGVAGSGQTHQPVPTAEYGFRVLGMRMTTSLSMDAGEYGESSVPTTRLQASLPLPGDRGEIEAGYSFVDVDRLRELSLNSLDPSARGHLDRRRLDHDGRSRFHVTGEVPVGGAVSVRVGYELRAADESTSSSASVLGAGFEYRLGDRGNVTADLRWSTKPQNGQGEAGVGFGYRLGENTSFVASYSMISFESAKDAVTSGLGEAELVVRF